MLNFKDEDALIKYVLENINYNFNLTIIKDASGVHIIYDEDKED